jgi:hypothetical protein
LRIEDYFRRVREAIEACPATQTFSVAYDKRSTYEGYVRGEITFIDGSVLHLREFVDTEADLERLMCVYQYVDTSSRLVFRYDNTGHHKNLGISTYPDHKHVDEAVLPSSAPELREILSEIEGLINPHVFV